MGEVEWPWSDDGCCNMLVNCQKVENGWLRLDNSGF